MGTLYPDWVRLPRAEKLLAWAAAFVGVIGLVSALTPEMANRVEIVRGILPPGWPEAARVLTVAFAIGLIWLSRSLAKRRRRAWQLAVAVVVASAAAHLAKGLDFEEAAISLLLLVALVRRRHCFDVPGGRASVRPLLGLGAAFAGIAAVALGDELRGAELSHRTADALLGLGIALAFLALYYWLRPFGQVVAQTVGERRVARALVDAYGSDSLSFFALRRDKSYLFSPSRRAFLAYRVVAGTALVSGDPVGAEAEIDDLLAELQRLVRAHGLAACRRRRLRGAPRPLPARSGSSRCRWGRRRCCGRRRSRSRGGRSARCGSRSRGSARPATRSASSQPTRSSRASGPSSRRSPRPGAAARRSAASRWRSTSSTSRGRCSPSPWPGTGASAASSISPRRRRAAAGR